MSAGDEVVTVVRVLGAKLRSAPVVVLAVLLSVVSASAVAPRVAGAAEAPEITVTPSSGVRDGQAVHVRGRGFEPVWVELGLCPAGVTGPGACQYGPAVMVDATGEFAVDHLVAAFFVTDDLRTMDCRIEGVCEEVVFAGRDVLARAPIRFDPDSEVVTAQLSVEPATGLTHHHDVAVHGTGFTAGAILSQCTRTGRACTYLGNSLVADDGRLTTTARVMALLRDTADRSIVDCRDEAGACVLRAQNYGNQRMALAPLAFEPGTPVVPATLTASPSTGLVDGQVVSFEGSGFNPAASVPLYLQVCPAATDCGSQGVSVKPDAEGRITGSLSVFTMARVGAEHADCRVTRCELRVRGSGDPSEEPVVALAFDPAGPLRPDPTVRLSASSGLRDGQTVAVHAEQLRSGVSYFVQECAADTRPVDSGRCGPASTLTGAGDGTAEAQLLVDARFEPEFAPSGSGMVDCRVAPGCAIVLQGEDTWVATPVAFAAPAAGTRYRDRVFDDVEVTRDLVYGRAVGADGVPTDLTLDLYQPAGDVDAKRPAIVYAHGGYFAFGNKSEGARVGRELARRGYVVVSIRYRLFPGENWDVQRLAAAMPAAQHDAQAAVRWLRANAGEHRVAPGAIGIMGYSAGAVTALNVAYHRDTGDSGNPGFASTVSGAVSLAGAIPSPEAGGPPSLMIHGTADDVVSYQWGVDSCEALNQLGNSCELVSYPGLSHAIYNRYGDWLPLVVAFFERTVVPGIAAPPTVPTTTTMTVPITTTMTVPTTTVPITTTTTTTTVSTTTAHGGGGGGGAGPATEAEPATPVRATPAYVG